MNKFEMIFTFSLILLVLHIVNAQQSNGEIIASFFDSAFDAEFNSTKYIALLTQVDKNLKVLAKNELYPQTYQPVLHHWFNLLMLGGDAKTKQLIVETAKLAIEHGLDVSIQYKEDPPIYTKSLITKEIGLAQYIIAHGQRQIITDVIARSSKFAKFLKTLYAIPSEMIPVIKLLLHIEKITRPNSDVIRTPNFNSTAFAIALLEQARLEKPSIKASELFQFSNTYHDVILRLAKHENFSSIVTLHDVIESLDQLASRVQSSIVQVILQNERKNIAIEHFLDLHLHADENHRNCFHFLVMSGASHMINALKDLFQALPENPSEHISVPKSKSEIAKRILSKLHLTDSRGHSPFTYCLIRFGKDSKVCQTYMEFVKELCNAAEISFDAVEHEQEESLNKIDPLYDLLRTKETRSVEVTLTTEGDTSTVPKEEMNVNSGKFGGWNPQRLYNFDTHRCDILEIWNETLPMPAQFFARFVNQGRPVIFRHAGLHPEGRMKMLQKVFEKGNFIKTYGRVKVDAAVIPYGASFGVHTSTKSLKDIATSDQMVTIAKDVNNNSEGNGTQQIPLYAFQTPSPQWQKRLTRDVPVPEPLFGIQKSITEIAPYQHEVQFYLGSAGTGAPTHYHGHAINSLAYGEKKWFLLPPQKGFYTTISSLEFFELVENIQKLSPEQIQSESQDPKTLEILNLMKDSLTCTQRAGDIMFVPTLWSHSTLNIRQSIGVAHEFSVESFCME